MRGIFGDPKARVIGLNRRSKKRHAAVAVAVQVGWYDRKICRVRDLSCGDTRIFLELEVRRLDCRNCGKVKRERLDFLADNPHYTKRFAYYVGRRCRSATIKDVAADLRLDWHTVKTLDQQYMQAQLARAGRPGPQVIGIDEIAIRKGHTYRIVVSDLLRGAARLVPSDGQVDEISQTPSPFSNLMPPAGDSLDQHRDAAKARQHRPLRGLDALGKRAISSSRESAPTLPI